MDNAEKIIDKPAIDFRRDQDFLNRYANNTNLESTGWDLKITFGQTDLQIGPSAVVQHTAITLPWPYVKVFSYLLQIHVAAKEAEDGRILVPQNVVAPMPDSLPEDTNIRLKHPKEGLEAMRKIYEEFIATNPEVVKP